MTITDGCNCGAEFKAKGWPPNVRSQHIIWLNHHLECRTPWKPGRS